MQKIFTQWTNMVTMLVKRSGGSNIDFNREEECSLCRSLADLVAPVQEATLNVLAKNVVSALFQAKLDCLVIWTLG